MTAQTSFIKQQFQDCDGFNGDIWSIEKNITQVTLLFNEKAKNDEVGKVLSTVLSALLWQNKNVQIVICEEKNSNNEFAIVCISQDEDYIPIHKKTFLNFHHVLDFEDGLKLYNKETGNTDKDKEVVFVGQQLSLMVVQLFLKFNIKNSFYEYGVEGEYLIGWGQQEKFEMTLIQKLQREMNLNQEGLFWKRDWVNDKDKLPTSGGGKI